MEEMYVHLLFLFLFLLTPFLLFVFDNLSMTVTDTKSTKPLYVSLSVCCLFHFVRKIAWLLCMQQVEQSSPIEPQCDECASVRWQITSPLSSTPLPFPSPSPSSTHTIHSSLPSPSALSGCFKLLSLYSNGESMHSTFALRNIRCTESTSTRSI